MPLVETTCVTCERSFLVRSIIIKVALLGGALSHTESQIDRVIAAAAESVRAL